MAHLSDRPLPTKVNNPCPICKDTSGDCRTNYDVSLILCHDFIELDSGVGGYKFIKTSSNGVWGVHVLDNGKEFNREQYERYLAQQEAQERNKKQFLADNALDAEGRDRAIRKLSRHVGSNDRHRDDLKRRGLSDRDIEDGLFFSIDPWTRFNLNLPDNLPGIHYKGDRFTTRDTGFTCPAFDKQGRAIGWQLRLDEVTKGNKYKWALSNFSSHLPNGELPITVLKPPENSSTTLYLSEGILKPYIASHRLNIAVCGAAGGYFRGSPQQLSEIVSDYDELVIVPDAGDVLNSHVMRRWERQINFLKRFNKPIKILWWGQISKDRHQDIDEIDSVTFSKAEYLSTSEFIELAKKERYFQQQWDNWKNSKKFTPQIKIEKEFIEYGLPQANTITLIKSGLGTGKTTQLIKHLLQIQEYGIIGLGYRNTLLLQFNEKAKEIGFYHLQSDKNLREFSLDDPGVKVTNCVDSLIHYYKEQFDGKIIIIDEVVSVIKHFLFSSTIKQFSKIKELFTEMVNRADRLICLDGFMQDWVVKLFKELCPSKQIVTLENTYKGNKAQVYLLEGTIDINERVRANDKTPWLEKLLNSDCPVICSDSQIFCEAIENLLLQQGRIGIRVDSKTVSEKQVKNFFTAPNQYIEKNRPEYLIYSPSAESGLDVPIKNYFTDHFAFFFGQLDIDSCIQMLGRIRDTSVPKYVWCKQFIIPEDNNHRPSNVEAIQANRMRSLMAELHLTLNSIESPETKIARIQQIYQENLDPYTTAADTIQDIRNHEFRNYRECLKRQLIDSGYVVEAVTLESLDHHKAIAKIEKEAKTEVKEQNSLDIYNASDKYIGQNQVNLKFDANWSTRCEVIKAQLVSRLPDINRDPIWSPKFIKLLKYDKPNLIRQCELYYLLDNLELAKQLAQEKYNGIFNRGNIAASWKLRQNYSKVKALRDVGVYDFIQYAIANPEFTYTANSTEVKAVLDKCRSRKNRDILGTPGKDPVKLINKLLRSLGIEVNSRQERNENGDRDRSYSINYKSLFSEERLAILQSIELKYEEKINSKNKPLEWSQNPENNLKNSQEKSAEPKTPQTIDAHSLDPVTLAPKFSINNSTNCDNQNNHQSLVKSSREKHNTNQIQDPWDGEEVIADLTFMLSIVDSPEVLRILTSTEGFTRERLNLAARRLPLSQQRKLREWAIENRSSTA